MKFLLFLWLPFLSILSVACSQCLDGQKLLLLQLKHNLSFSFPASGTLVSWDSSTDCCAAWEGVKCDGNGHVTSLDLSYKAISGGFEAWSSLFELKYLERLSLAYNNFNSTAIPFGLDRLENLKYLNLSNSGFSMQIPVEISHMKRLVSLDLSTILQAQYPLKLENPDLKTLVKDLFELTELYLDGVDISTNRKEWCKALSSSLPNLHNLSLSNCGLSGPLESSLLNLRSLSWLRLDGNGISSPVPDFFGNFTKLSFLHLSSCEMHGKFPEKIFHMPLLKSLDISGNPLIQGSLPEFPQNGVLENLALSYTYFSGKLPESIQNLRLLVRLELSNCHFSGSIPTSVSTLTRLKCIDLSCNNFTGAVPYFGLSENLTQVNLAHNRLTGPISSIQWGRHLHLVTLNLRNNSLNGTIPSTLFSLPLLQKLMLSQNQFTGLLSEFSNRSSLMLDTLDLSINKLEGPIPSSIFGVSSLKIIALFSNNLNGTLRLDRFQGLRNLSSLDLTGNNLSIISNGTNSALFPQVGTLNLGSCNLRTFPEFLINQSTLSYLDLSNNQIPGKIPNWIWKIGNGSLMHLNVSFNSLENPDQPFPSDQFKTLAVLDMHSNSLRGSVPILPPFASVLDYSYNEIISVDPVAVGSSLSFAIFFSLSHNLLRGEIPSSVCNAKYLQVLDLSYNRLSGPIPKCIANISTLSVLNLRSNELNGTILQSFPGGCNLRTLDLNMNNLEGEVSKSLANCRMIEVLDLGNNHIQGPFPSWLGELSLLRVLVLRSNNFSGSIQDPETNNSFQMLQIIDLSSNNFRGHLPAKRFLRWTGMMNEEESESHYKHSILRFGFLELSKLYYQNAVTVTSKGQQMELVKILTIFTSIDFSNNNFGGEIPEVIGNLTALYVLNLSHNALVGSVLPSLGNIKQLESLDLSSNRLSGSIPSRLLDLTFLSVLNLSFNNLAGEIPQGRQFQTFNENMFEGNIRLCGPPLLRTCYSPEFAPSPSSIHRSSKSAVDFDWQIIITGFGFGGGAALIVAPLWFWKEGRKWHDKQMQKLLLIMFPAAALISNSCDNEKADETTEESLEDEFTELIDNDEDGFTEGISSGSRRYCVFCTKLSMSQKVVVHNPKCSCHILLQNSTLL